MFIVTFNPNGMYMESDITELLTAAIELGSDVNIIYLAGSQPGAVRKIAPIAFLNNGSKLRAKCRVSGAVKTFNTDKILLPDEANKIIHYGNIVNKTYEKISDVKDELLSLYPSIEGMWELECDVEYLGVYERSKVKGFRKRPVLYICFIEYTECYGFIAEEKGCNIWGATGETTLRKHPWRVACAEYWSRARRAELGMKEGHSYQSLDNAAADFFERFSKLLSIGYFEQP
jgi:hypothetical protein